MKRCVAVCLIGLVGLSVMVETLSDISATSTRNLERELSDNVSTIRDDSAMRSQIVAHYEMVSGLPSDN
jgi:hypothetical protein